jgi:hypothetical protein
MTEKTRRNLDKAIGDLIESFVKFDKNEVMHLKVGLQAIHNAQKNSDPASKTNLYAVRDKDFLHKLLEDHGISRSEFEKIPEIMFGSKASAENHMDSLPEQLREAVLNVDGNHSQTYEIPTPGMVAVMFNMVSEKVKNALVAGQAGERTLRAIERATTVSYFPAMKDAALKDTLYDYGNSDRPARSHIDRARGEPDYLVSAKATHHLADLFESSLKLHPASKHFESTAKSAEAFNKLAACIFDHSADHLDKASEIGAAEEIKALAVSVKNGDKKLVTSEACDVVESGMNTLREAMHAEGIITEKESEDFKAMVTKRIDQIKRMEMV